MGSPRFVVTGGDATDVEMAALTAALTHHLTRHRRVTVASAPEPTLSPWTRAARLEGCGHPPIDNPARLRDRQ